MTRRCPHCGEAVPSNSLNCPKCFKSIPREEFKIKDDIRAGSIPHDRSPSVHRVNIKIVILLALIPAAIGFMGLAQIYEKETSKGVKFLIIGFIIFALMVFLISRYGSMGGWTFLAVAATIFLLIMYIGLYVL